MKGLGLKHGVEKFGTIDYRLTVHSNSVPFCLQPCASNIYVSSVRGLLGKTLSIKSLKFQKCVCFNYHTPLAILTLALLFLLAACWIYGDTTNFFQFLSKSVVPTNDGRPSPQYRQDLSEVAFKQFCL